MKTTQISEEDVLGVASDLGITLTSSEIEFILVEYPSACEDDPTSNWNEIVENLIYSLQ